MSCISPTISRSTSPARSSITGSARTASLSRKRWAARNRFGRRLLDPSQQWPQSVPWVHVHYSLNGPNVDSSAVSGANGLVGLHVTVAPNPLADTDYANTTIPVIAFTVPTKVTSEITGSSGTLVTQNGTDMLVVAVGRPARTTSFDFFFTAKHCSMSPLAVAAVEASDTAEFSRSMTALATRASNLSDIAIGGGKHDTAAQPAQSDA